MTNPKLVHIVDDDEAIRRSAGFLLKVEGYRVATYESGVSLLKAARHLDPGCILLDVRMPELDGLEVQHELAERGVSLPVVMLTGHGDVSVAVRAMKAGAIDFIEKPFEKSVLLQAIGTAFRHLDEAAESAIRAAEAAVRIAALTAREQDVLRGLADGLQNKKIAHGLGISPRTVEIHRANLMAKLGARTFSEALRIAFAAAGHPKVESHRDNT